MLELKLADKTISTENPAFVMSILNVTPDSFFERSRGGIEKAKQIIEEGADILDIGAESSRPGAEYVSAEEEIKRLIPVIEQIRKFSDIPISVDTRKFSVMKACFESGANILNDISALEDDEKMVPFVAETKMPVILMHKRGLPSQMQKNTQYSNVFNEVNEYLTKRAIFAEQNGIESEKIIVDPGVGFGKDLQGNIELIKNCGKLCSSKYKILMALSRKTCIGEMTGKSVQDRLYGTLAANLLSVINGASLVRVHDTKETIDILKVLRYIK